MQETELIRHGTLFAMEIVHDYIYREVPAPQEREQQLYSGRVGGRSSKRNEGVKAKQIKARRAKKKRK